MWQRKQYEEAAADIGKQYADVGAKDSINDLSVKVARDNNLNPEGIRTLVRLANVSAFQELFTKSAGADRMIEYQVGDPELVITQLYSETKTAAVLAQVTPTDYDRTRDYYGNLSQLAKVAEDDDEEKDEIVEEELDSETQPDAPIVDKKKVKLLFDKSKNKIEDDAKEAEYRWVSCIEKAAQTLRCGPGSSPQFNKYAFEKDMVAAGGEGIVTELKALSLFTGTQGTPFCGGAKVASILEYHAPKLTQHAETILGFLKEAAALREYRTRCCAGLDLLTKKMALV